MPAPAPARWLREYGLPAGAIVGLVVLWEVVVDAFQVPEYLVAPPSGVAAEFVKEWRYLAFHSWVTLKEILAGFVLAMAFGVPMAMVLVYSSVLERTLYPLLVSSQSVPKIAIAPLLIFWFGIGTFPKVLVAFLISFFPIIIDTVVGLRSVEPEMIHLARSMGAGEMKIFRKIRLPNALPNIFAGLKVAVTLAVVGAIIGEFIQSDQGLGYALHVAAGNLNTRLSFAIILVLGLIGVVLFVLVDVIERVVVPWHVSRRSELAAGTL